MKYLLTIRNENGDTEDVLGIDIDTLNFDSQEDKDKLAEAVLMALDGFDACPAIGA